MIYAMKSNGKFNFNNISTTIIESSAEAISILDASGCFEYINNYHEEVLGYSSSELEGVNAAALIPPEDQADAADKFAVLIENKGRSTDVWRFRHKNGKYISFSCRAAVFKDEQGNQHTVVFSNDISDSVRLNEKQKALYSIFFDLSSDPEKNIEIIVKKACQILEGVCSIYNRVELAENKIISRNGYNLPEDYEYTDRPQGHICYEEVVMGDEEIVEISDLDKTVYKESDINVSKYNLKSYIGSSISIENEKVGSLCVVYTVGRFFSEEDREIIHTLAKALSLEEMRKEVENKLRNSLLEKEYLMKEINHRVKNNLMMITSMIRLKEDSERGTDFSDLKHQIDAIRIVHEKLYTAGDVSNIEIKPYFTELIETILNLLQK